MCQYIYHVWFIFYIYSTGFSYISSSLVGEKLFFFWKENLSGGFWFDVFYLNKVIWIIYVLPAKECFITTWRIHLHISAKWWKFTCEGQCKQALVYQPFICKIIVPITWIFASLPLMHLSRQWCYVHTIYLSFPVNKVPCI